MTIDMGPSRTTPHPGIPYDPAGDHMRHCPHCSRGYRKESCEAYQAMERDFARQHRLQTGGAR